MLRRVQTVLKVPLKVPAITNDINTIKSNFEEDFLHEEMGKIVG
jgi:hypothetical protein